MEGSSLQKWLSSLDLKCYSEAFKNAHLDFGNILLVSDEYLTELGVSEEHRVKLRNAMDELSNPTKQMNLTHTSLSSGQGDINKSSKRNLDQKTLNRSRSAENFGSSRHITSSPGNISPRKPSPQSTQKDLKLMSEPDELVFKVLVVGDPGTGKSSLIHRYQTGNWNPTYKTTIGSDFLVKEFVWDNSTKLVIHFWDIAGQERFSSLTRVYYRQSKGAIVVFDVTRPKTFDDVAKWKADLDAKVSLPDGSPLPVVLFANKVDLLTDPVKLADMSISLVKYCKENGFKGPYFTSAKTGYGIEKGFYSLVEMMLPKSFSVPQYPNAGLLVPVKKTSFNLLDSQEMDIIRGFQKDNKKNSCAC